VPFPGKGESQHAALTCVAKKGKQALTQDVRLLYVEFSNRHHPLTKR